MVFNKKGATYGGWIETILFLVLFIGALALISTSMNGAFGKNKDLTYGIVTNDTLNSLTDYQKTLNNATSEGQSSYSSLGILQLTTLPKLINTLGSLIWTFITGGFINSLVNLMNLGEYASLVIIVFKLLYFIGLGLILLKILTRVIV